MNKILSERGVGGNEFHTNAILSAIEESNKNMLSVMKNVTTISGNEDVLPNDKEREDLCLINEGAEVGDPGTEEVDLNEDVQLVIDQRRQATKRTVMNRRTITIVSHHGSLQVLPPTWTLPRMKCKQLIDNWYVGNKR